MGESEDENYVTFGTALDPLDEGKCETLKHSFILFLPNVNLIVSHTKRTGKSRIKYYNIDIIYSA